MDRDQPSGSGSGKGGMNPFFWRPRRDESPPNNGRQNQGVVDNSNVNGARLNNNHNVFDWMAGLQDLNQPHNLLNGNGLDRVDNSGQQPRGGFWFSAYFEYGGNVRFQHIQAEFSFAGAVGAPVQGLGGQPVFNGFNAVGFGGRPGMDNAGGHGNIPGNHAGPQGQGLGGGFGPMPVARLCHCHFYGIIYYYYTTTTYAHHHRDGETMSSMLSIRDAHVFHIMNALDYANGMYRPPISIDLRNAMVHHFDCVKALMARNLSLALRKQIACVNAIMRLLNDAYRRQEEWTYIIINTVTDELTIISQKAISAGCRGRVIIRHNWPENNYACFYHPLDCPCRRSLVLRKRF